MFTYLKALFARAFLQAEVAKLEAALEAIVAKVEPLAVAEGKKIKAEVQLEVAKAKVVLMNLKKVAAEELAEAEIEIKKLEDAVVKFVKKVKSKL